MHPIDDGSATPRLSSVDEAEFRQRAIDDIMTDETMSVADRQARLEALAAQWHIPSDSVIDNAASDPFRVQIANALSLLAQGGHRNAP